MPSPVPPTEELIFERLLAALLERGGPETNGADAPPDLLELRDMARRLRASVQWMPLPRSRLTLRRALLATVEAARSRPAGRQSGGDTPAAWGRTVRWLTGVTAATFLTIGAALSAHALEMALLPSGPLYGITLQIDAMRVQFAGDAMHRAATLLDVTRARAADVGAMAYGDDPRGVEEAAAALERENRWLRNVARSLPPADQQRLAPAATKSETLVVAARRAAQLRRDGRLPSGVTMAELLSAGSGPLSGAATTDVSPSSEGSRDGSRGAGPNNGASRLDSGGGPARRESGGAFIEGGAGTAGAQSGSGASDGGMSVSGGLTDRDGGITGGGAGAASKESQKSGGEVDSAAGSGSGANPGPDGRGGAGGHNASSRSDSSSDGHASGGGQGDGGGSDGGHNR
ncbi:MAG TPA: hypothetical protein VKW09_02835 [bacterium]|nr:hypothetical protein [bacterium]